MIQALEHPIGEKPKRFKILSLDGGGIRGLVSAYMLLEIEKQLKENGEPPIREYFDMIAGTSTGSILAAGIALGYPIEELIDIYEKRGLEIFPYQKLYDWKRLKLLFKYGISAPKFSNEGLINLLKKEKRFQKQEEDGTYRYITLQEVGKDVGKDEKKPIVLILAFDTIYRNTTFFTNDSLAAKNKRWFNNIPLWEICVSSASAPTFFPAYELKYREQDKEDWTFPHVDGGVTANNPSLCAIARAIKLGHKLEDISLLSIGTGENKNPLIFNKIVRWGLIEWGLRISDVFMEGQAEVQSRICTELMGGAASRRYLRLQFELNDVFGTPTNDLAQAPILPKQGRKNFWTKQHIKEVMDDARPDNITQLVNATQEYLSKGNVFEDRYEHYGSVRNEIKEFISGTCQPRECIKKGKDVHTTPIRASNDLLPE
jgi:hypothetical protein